MLGLGIGTLVLVGGLLPVLVAFVDAYGCRPLPTWDELTWRGVAEDLDAALAASPGVEASGVAFTSGSCSASTHGAPPHLSINARLALDELWYLPGDQAARVGPTTPAPDIAAAILRDIEASGQPFALSVSAGYPVLAGQSWSR